MSKKFLLAALALALGTPALHAATEGEIELTRAIIEVQRKAIVETNMQLDDETAKKFWPLFNEYQNAKRKISDQKIDVLKDYGANWLDLSEEKAKELMTKALQVQSKQAKLKRQYFKKFSKQLPPKVAARYFQVENKLDAIIDYDLAQQVPLVH